MQGKPWAGRRFIGPEDMEGIGHPTPRARDTLRETKMNFDLTDEQKQIRDTFARFCDERIAPQAAALDEARAFPRALFQELADLGFFGMRYPEDVGGRWPPPPPLLRCAGHPTVTIRKRGAAFRFQGESVSGPGCRVSDSRK